MKKINMRRYSIGVFLIGVSFFAAGCATKIGMFEPQTHFAFPNSNVEPLGQVTAEVSKTTVVVPKAVDKELLDEVMNKALQAKGGDLLINCKINTTTTAYPIPILGPYTTKLTVEGTACKMTVGRQELK